MFGFFPGLGGDNNLIAPSGTSIPMSQASPPVGWISSVVTDTSMRYNSGSGGAGGGSVNWSSWNFGGTFNVNTFTINTSQMPTHSHGLNDPGHVHGVTDGGHNHAASSGRFIVSGGGSNTFPGGGAAGIGDAVASFTGIGINLNGTNASIANAGSGTGITPSYTTPQVKYVDHILAVKS